MRWKNGFAIKSQRTEGETHSGIRKLFLNIQRDVLKAQGATKCVMFYFRYSFKRQNPIHTPTKVSTFSFIQLHITFPEKILYTVINYILYMNTLLSVLGSDAMAFIMCAVWA